MNSRLSGANPPGIQAGHIRKHPNNVGDHVLPLSFLSREILLEVKLQRRHKAGDLLFAHFHWTAYAVIGVGVQGTGADQITPPHDQAGTLRPTDVLATAEYGQVRAHIEIKMQVLHRR